MSQIIGQSGEVGGEIPREKDLSLVLLDTSINKASFVRKAGRQCPRPAACVLETSVGRTGLETTQTLRWRDRESEKIGGLNLHQDALNLGSRYPPAPGRGETEQKVQHWKKPNLLAPHTTQVTPVSSGWPWVLPDLQHAVPGPTCRAGFELGPLAASTGNDHPSGGGPGHLLTQ